jgi:hypothetical protein
LFHNGCFKLYSDQHSVRVPVSHILTSICYYCCPWMWLV